MLWLFFVLAQRSPGTMAPATHPSAVNSAVKRGGLGRKPTKTTAKQNGVSKVCLFFRVCLCVCTERNKLIFFLISAICLFVGDSQTSVKRLIVVIPQQVSISEQSPFFHSAGNLPPHNIVACVPVLPHTYSQEQI